MYHYLAQPLCSHDSIHSCLPRGHPVHPSLVATTRTPACQYVCTTRTAFQFIHPFYTSGEKTRSIISDNSGRRHGNLVSWRFRELRSKIYSLCFGSHDVISAHRLCSPSLYPRLARQIIVVHDKIKYIVLVVSQSTKLEIVRNINHKEYRKEAKK